MNICFIMGKILNKIDLKFVYDKNKKSLSKKNISVVKLELELGDKQKIEAKAYNEMADYIYKNIKQNDIVLIKGKLRENYIDIEEC